MDRKNLKRIIAPGVLSLLLVLALVWGYNQNRMKASYEQALENHYQRLFFDVKKHVENVQVNLSKAMASKSRDQNVVLLSQIMNEAFFAQDKLAQMPISHADTAKTEKFLNQAADYSSYLIKTHLEGQDLTQDQKEALQQLQGNTTAFNQELNKLHDSLADSTFLFNSMINRQENTIREGNDEVFQTSLVSIDKQMGKTPELIYDGPFADQMVNRKPVGLPSNNVSSQEGERIAIEFFGKDRVAAVEQFEEGENFDEVRIPAHTFHLYPSNQQKDLAVYMGVSKKGGKVIWMANPRPVSNQNLSIKEAEDKALQYLKDKGFKNMEPNYSLRYDGGVLFNFAATQEDVTIYPDLIKVKVALDTGEIIGFDASTYYMNHKDRNIESPKLTKEEAREYVKTNFDINSIRLAIIPKGKDEKLCYEFKGKYNDSDFIIYINAFNGKEEDILQIIKNENGTLTF